MPVVLEVEHTTTYTYANPVTFGEHRAIFLPRGSHGGRILGYEVKTSIPSRTHWISDTLSNNVAVIAFNEPGSQLSVTCKFRVVHFGLKGVEAFPLDSRAELIPVQYTPSEWTDLVVYLQPCEDDPDGSVAAWAKSFTLGDLYETRDVLQRMMNTVRDTFTYEARNEEGTRTPGETLAKKSGTCRDYAWLMIEALRRLGIACRFVTGYLYDSALDGGDDGKTGSGATHAWLEVYLPGAGWLSYDPTNRITEGFDLIQVAIARRPEQAVPLAGSWFGAPGDYLGMKVDVAVRKLAALPDFT
ncbi:MAG: transglutaminase family protein [Gammaproteobacteria bacterium]|nr:transglutaminase family protein [Gammaproteobacteria bacterium]